MPVTREGPAAFLPGELTQSLCSPWTHDFRDCGCFYWATNHPDIVQPVYPAAEPPADRQPWQAAVPWQRLDRSRLPDPPQPATSDARPSELRHYEINQRWEELHFVVGRREITAPFVAKTVRGEPFSSLAVLLPQLHYAVGVELAVAQEYLSAAYSLKADDDPSLSGTPGLRDDVRATRAELMRIAIGEMRHTRAVNDVIRGLMPAGTYAPALRVARVVPHAGLGSYRPVQPRAATRQAITDFIDIEAPSAGVDGLYVDILETLINPPADMRPVAVPEWSEAIGSVIAEGEDHYQTFLDIQEWLGVHPEATYLRTVNPPRPTPGQPEHDALQGSYVGVLELLHAGYAKGRFEGADEINAARMAMVAPGGLDTLAHAVAQKGFLVAFDDITDSRFAPIDPPPAPLALPVA